MAQLVQGSGTAMQLSLFKESNGLLQYMISWGMLGWNVFIPSQNEFILVWNALILAWNEIIPRLKKQTFD